MRKAIVTMVTPMILLVGMIGTSAAPAVAAVSDPKLTGSASDWSAGKYADVTAVYSRTENQTRLQTYTESPYLFAAARATYTITYFADTPFGQYPLHVESRSVTACATTDPSCASKAHYTFHLHAPTHVESLLKQYASSIRVEASVR